MEIILLWFCTIIFVVSAQNVFVDPCMSAPCLKGGRCDRIGSGANYLCVCVAGHWGQHCEYDPGEMPCDGHKCQNGATCRPDHKENVRYRCLCDKAYTGQFCNVTKTSTAKQRCALVCGERGVAFIDRKKRCQCNCHKNLYENENNDKNCSKKLGCWNMPCGSGGTCKTKGERDYDCNCSMYFKGTNCSEPVYCRYTKVGGKCRPDEVNPCPPKHCKNDGTCLLVPSDRKSRSNWVRPKARCICQVGFKGQQCETKATPCTLTDEEEECNANIDDPSVNAECGNMTEKFEVCYNDGTCIILGEPPNERKSCKCQNKWIGKDCSMVNPCLANSSICSKDSVCLALPSEFGSKFHHLCVCQPGYSDNDCHALDPNVCNSTKSVCHHGGICIRCYDESSPTSSPYCRTKEDFEQQYVCACAIRRTGRLCDQTTLPCDVRRCKNGGRCIDMNETDYTCECLDGYSGDSCELVDDMCVARTPCRNGGYCSNIESILGFECSCQDGYYGIVCQREYNEFGGYFMNFHLFLAIWSFIAGCTACILFGLSYSIILICIVRTKEKQI